ncbi:MAG: DEAD/DEAH box helicase, partial [Candidatus Poseidoniaceae archaeon]|nr:DEAD/DEAH box helicase [Candidatus Poseidoniaceae archaeon]
MGEPERAVSRLGLPEDFVQFVENDWGIKTLHPPQAEAMPSILAGRNTMLCIPTASGKSLVAFMGLVNQIMTRNVGSRGIYIVPLKALASEKLEELKQLGESLGLKIGLGIGDAPNEA